MSEENNNLGDDIKKGVEDAAESVKDAAKEFTDEAREIINSQDNKKVLVGIIAIFLGSLGIHKFILGYTKEGVIMLIMGIAGFFTCGITSGISWVVGLVEGIMYLTKSDEEFYETYQVGRKPWF